MRISDWSSDVCSSDLVDGLPRRLSDRSLAAELTAQLNYQGDSSLKGLIHQHTNPAGIIRDTAIQKVIMNSLGDGVMRELIRRNNGRDECCALVSEFYRAVQAVFRSEWRGHTPTTCRMVHGRSEQTTTELQSLMR